MHSYSGNDNFTELQSKPSTFNSIGRSGKGSSSSQTITQPPLRGVEHNGLVRTSSKKGLRSPESLYKDDASLNARAESLSPSIQKFGHSRNSDSAGSSGIRRIVGGNSAESGKEKELGSQSHSRGSSMGTKSLTPNLSPKGTLSTSSSIGSLGNFDATAADESNVSSVADSYSQNSFIGGRIIPETSSESAADPKHLGIRGSEDMEDMFSGETWEDELDEDACMAEQMDKVEISSSSGVQRVTVGVSGDRVNGAGTPGSQSDPIGYVQAPVSDGRAVQTLAQSEQAAVIS